ncbi:Cyclic nucleotide-gated ion channel 17 [Linum grandiflorum]
MRLHGFVVNFLYGVLGWGLVKFMSLVAGQSFVGMGLAGFGWPTTGQLFLGLVVSSYFCGIKMLGWMSYTIMFFEGMKRHGEEVLELVEDVDHYTKVPIVTRVSGSGYTKSEVIMVDPTEAKRLAAKQMVEIRRKEKLERRKEIEAINGAWAMIGLTAGLVIEGYTGKSILEQDPKLIARRYIRSDFFIDLIATLPLPQIVVWFIIPATRKPRTDDNNNALALIATGLVTRTAWAGAAYNLLLYMLASHTYLQSLTVRLEEWRLKRRDTEEWMKHRQLPEDLRHRVRRFVQYKWVATRGVHEDDILRGLPTDLRRDIQRHLCLDLVRRVPFFSQMDDQLLDAICERLVSCLSTQGTYIVREGDPVTEMLFIIRGSLESSTTNGGRTGFFNSIMLKPGDFCGEELLAWALQPKSSLNLPSSTRTVRALNEVEAFALRAEDLRFVANQFRRLHSKKLQHTFRYHSHHWRSWAACFIQAAWRRHKKRLVEHSLTMSESFHMNAQLLEEGASLNAAASSSHRAKVNLGVTMLASRFAANTRRGVQKMKEVDAPKLQKPEEPDFSADADADAD